MFRFSVSAGALIAALSSPAFAQTPSAIDSGDHDQAREDVIIVTGTRLATPPSETGTAISVIDRPQLERRAFALDAIAATPGVTVSQNGAFGGTAAVRIRGASSEQTLVLIDSVPVNDPTSPGGGYNFATLDTAQIERIEILRGAQSTLWGTDAIGGVVNIVTRQPEPGFGVSGFVEAGSFSTFRGGAAMFGADARGDFRLGITGITTDGISMADERDGNPERDGYEAITIAGRGGLNLGAFGRLELTGRYVDSENEFDSFGPETGVQDGDEVGFSEEFSGAATYRAASFNGALDTLLQIAWSEITRETFTDGEQSFFAEGERVIYRYQGGWNIEGGHRLAFGAEREEATANDDTSTLDGLFTVLEVRPRDGVVLSGGLRHDSSSRFGSETTGKLAASWAVTDAVRLRGTAGTGFKAPTIFQTTYGFPPNPDLEAETSRGFDIGADFEFDGGRGVIEATYFDQEVTNQIRFSSAISGYENIARVDSRGLELAARYQLTGEVAVSGHYTYIDAEDGASGALVRLPEHSGYAQISYDPNAPWSGTLSARYNGDEADARGTVSAWTRVDASAQYALNDNVEFYGRVENLFDIHYQEIFGYGTPGRSTYAGVRFRR